MFWASIKLIQFYCIRKYIPIYVSSVHQLPVQLVFCDFWRRKIIDLMQKLMYAMETTQNIMWTLPNMGELRHCGLHKKKKKKLTNPEKTNNQHITSLCDVIQENAQLVKQPQFWPISMLSFSLWLFLIFFIFFDTTFYYMYKILLWFKLFSQPPSLQYIDYTQQDIYQLIQIRSWYKIN